MEAEVSSLSQGESFSQEGAGGGSGEAACCAAKQSQEKKGKEIEIMNKPEIISFLSLRKLQDTHKDYSLRLVS